MIKKLYDYCRDYWYRHFLDAGDRSERAENKLSELRALLITDSCPVARDKYGFEFLNKQISRHQLLVSSLLHGKREHYILPDIESNIAELEIQILVYLMKNDYT